jgi:hypothetical protein
VAIDTISLTYSRAKEGGGINRCVGKSAQMQQDELPGLGDRGRILPNGEVTLIPKPAIVQVNSQNSRNVE